MLIPSYVLDVCHQPVLTMVNGAPVEIPDPNHAGRRTYEYSWQRGTKVSTHFQHFNLMGNHTFYMSVNSVTIGDYPILPNNTAAVNNSFNIKSNWTGDDVLQTFGIHRGTVKQQIHGVNFPDNSCIHLVTKHQQNLDLEIIPVFPTREDGLGPRDAESENVPYKFPVKFVDYSKIRLSIIVHLYKA